MLVNNQWIQFTVLQIHFCWTVNSLLLCILDIPHACFSFKNCPFNQPLGWVLRKHGAGKFPRRRRHYTVKHKFKNKQINKPKNSHASANSSSGKPFMCDKRNLTNRGNVKILSKGMRPGSSNFSKYHGSLFGSLLNHGLLQSSWSQSVRQMHLNANLKARLTAVCHAGCSLTRSCLMWCLTAAKCRETAASRTTDLRSWKVWWIQMKSDISSQSM